MDVSKVKFAENSDKGAVLTVLDPTTDVPTDLKITLAGTDSAIYRNWVKNSINRKLGMKKNKKFSYEESEHSGVELLAALTLGWEGLEFEGKPVKFTTEQAYDLYADPNMKWLREQVDEFVADRANFFL